MSNDLMIDVLVKDMMLSTSIKNILNDNGIYTLQDLVGKEKEDFLEMHGMGKTKFMELKEYLFFKHKVRIKARKKDKKPKLHPDSLRVAQHFLGHKNPKDVENWPLQMKHADLLIQMYGAESLLKTKPNTKAYSIYFYLTKFGGQYLEKNKPKIVSVIQKTPVQQEVVESSDENIDYTPLKPKNIKEFLGI